MPLQVIIGRFRGFDVLSLKDGRHDSCSLWCRCMQIQWCACLETPLPHCLNNLHASRLHFHIVRIYIYMGRSNQESHDWLSMQVCAALRHNVHSRLRQAARRPNPFHQTLMPSNNLHKANWRISYIAKLDHSKRNFLAMQFQRLHVRTAYGWHPQVDLLRCSFSLSPKEIFWMLLERRVQKNIRKGKVLCHVQSLCETLYLSSSPSQRSRNHHLGLDWVLISD